MNFPDRAAAGDKVNPNSLVYKILESELPRVVENVAQDDDFRGRRFSIDEGIGACIALPWLDAMVPALRRSTAPAGPPLRVVFVFAPNGKKMDDWSPPTSPAPRPIARKSVAM